MSTKLQSKRKLIDFLNVMKSVKESSFTHTSITLPAGSFYMDYNDLKTFNELYREAMKNDCELFLTEKHRDISPILLDFDFRFSVNVCERKYTTDMLKEVVNIYMCDMRRYVELPDAANVYVLEKSAPKRDEAKNLTKDGVHIIIPNVVTRPSVQMLVRKNVLEEMGRVFEPMGATNPIEDIFDEQVIWKNNWQMYGSKKPNSEPYVVTHHWTWTSGSEGGKKGQFESVPLLDDHTEYVSVLSIRNKFEESVLLEDNIDAVRTLDLQLKQSMEDKERKQNIYKKIVQSNESNFKPECEDLELVKPLITILKPERAESYGDWIRLGWCLRNISIDLLEEWDTFSKRSKKYEAGACDKLWYRMREGGLGMGTLHMWAKQDNPSAYAQLMSEDISTFIRRSMSQTDYDIALVIARMFKHRYRCSSHKHHTWYEYESHRWREIEKGYTLFYKEIPNKLHDEYQKAIERETIRSRTGDERDKDICNNNIETLNKIAKKLRSTNFVKDKMYKECSGLFYEPKFEDKLDSIPTLLGFENGVYDLENHEFREGRPEDYISLSTGINYIEYDKNNPLIEEIKDFMRKVLVNANVRDYVLTLFASILDGTNRDEKFHIWTGSGCHAYDTDIMMFDGQYKKVQDIVVGDEVMGDDSTKRNVLQLFNGIDNMYKITTTRGKQSFVVNEEHVLSLKITNTISINYRKNRSMWCVSWNERDDIEGIINRSKSTFGNEKDAIEFRDNILLNNTSVLKKNDIIDIKVKDYLRIIKKIGKRNLFLYRPDIIEFKSQDVSLDPYMLGYWLGDGFSQGSLFITPDQEVITYFDSELPSMDCKLTECKSDKENAKVMSISATKKTMQKNNFTKALIKYNLINNKHVPCEYKINSKTVRLQLLAGLLDSDGHYMYRKDTNVNQYEITLKNEELLDGVVFLAHSLGYGANKSKINKTCCNNGVVGVYYRCNIYGENLSDIPCKIPRKQAINTPKYRSSQSLGFDIEFVGKDNFYGFELDGNSRYIMEHELVTHNSNGKSKLVDLFQHTIGDYACIFNVSLLTQKRVGSSATNSELAIAKGKRFAILQEPEENERLNVGLMKELTGGDQIQCRSLFKEPIRFKPMFKMILTCNHMPAIPPDDGGTWRRVRRVEYTSKFVDNPDENNPNEFLIDRDLSYKFEQWKETFMVMLLKYYKRYKKKGKIVEPEEVMQYTKEYQRKNDVFADFCDCYVEKSDSKSDEISVNLLFEKFKEYCAVDNIKNKVNKTLFQEAMCSRYGKLVTSKGVKCWKGVRLIERETHDDDDEDDRDE